MFVSFGLSDPKNKETQDSANLHVRLYMGGASYGGIDFFDSKDVTFSDKNPNFKSGENYILVNKGSYLIRGKVKDVEFQLKYFPQLKPIFDVKDSKAGSFKWERMNWLVQMPRAKVMGWVRLKNKKVKVNAFGYHDSNWGEWVLVDGLWNWLQCNDKNISVEVGEVYNKNEGEIIVEFGGKIIIFRKNQYFLKHTIYENDGAGVKTPHTSIIEASNDDYKLELKVVRKINQCLHFKTPFFFLPDFYVDEQIAKFEGALHKKGKLVARINSFGFREYTTKAYTWWLKLKNMM